MARPCHNASPEFCLRLKRGEDAAPPESGPPAVTSGAASVADGPGWPALSANTCGESTRLARSLKRNAPPPAAISSSNHLRETTGRKLARKLRKCMKWRWFQDTATERDDTIPDRPRDSPAAHERKPGDLAHVRRKKCSISLRGLMEFAARVGLFPMAHQSDRRRRLLHPRLKIRCECGIAELAPGAASLQAAPAV